MLGDLRNQILRREIKYMLVTQGDSPITAT